VKAVMANAGSALMGIGSARGEDRARAAAEMAVSSPLLEASIEGAHGVLLSIAGGSDLGLFEVSAAANLIEQAAHEDANIIFGTVIDEKMGDEIRITVIATGFEDMSGRKNTVVKMSHLGSFKRDDLSKPAYLRKDKAIETTTTVKMGMIDDNDDPDLEIPTFLRRQAD